MLHFKTQKGMQSYWKFLIKVYSNSVFLKNKILPTDCCMVSSLICIVFAWSYNKQNKCSHKAEWFLYPSENVSSLYI